MCVYIGIGTCFTLTNATVPHRIIAMRLIAEGRMVALVRTSLNLLALGDTLEVVYESFGGGQGRQFGLEARESESESESGA